MAVLNYQRLHYFWVVAAEGTMVAASKRLGVAQPTISGQIQLLEEELGQPLFDRRGRRLELTPAGRVALRHAEEIFGLGSDLLKALEQERDDSSVVINVGVGDSLPKMVVRAILSTALELDPPVTIICREWRQDVLLAELAVHRMDLVLSDAPMPASIAARTRSFVAGSSGLMVCAPPAIAGRLRKGFPQSLAGAPMVLPSSDASVRRRIDEWMESSGIRPRIVASVDDPALGYQLAHAGQCAVVVSQVVHLEICRHMGFEPVGIAGPAEETYYVVAVERTHIHPAVDAICQAAASRVAALTRPTTLTQPTGVPLASPAAHSTPAHRAAAAPA